MRYLVPRIIEAGHEAMIAPFFGYSGPPLKMPLGGEMVQMLPPGHEGHINNIIDFHVRNWGIDAVISLCDVWIFNDWGEKGFVWLPRFPIDTHPISKPTLEAIKGCHTPLALTKWGQQELISAGWETAKYIPHGVDCDIYKPRDKAECREAVELPEDAFVAGMVAANSSEPSRKSFPEVVQAWRLFKESGGEGYLYLHTAQVPENRHKNGVDLRQIIETMGLTYAAMNEQRGKVLEADVLFSSQYKLGIEAYDDEWLAKLYNAFDVLLLPSRAEGFGIPLIEAQACGVPVVSNGVTSMPELTFAGECLEPLQWAWSTRKEGVKDGGWRGIADVDAIAEAIDWAANLDDDERENQAQLARCGALQFDWEALIEHRWLPLMEELSEWIA
jgi:glycosyltransferase involved in cell wall biosynthesis